ncbi:spindle and kinetochore-associated protein 1-like [Mya arenaria]|uniref:spindle and kinetochore-associated protein 1-like n=1 Tax=Mya arenaria TaxID=6604 RepID=UPI0022DF558C|nr:spindle and kinetochore-associated protein 1-like [Mya arenaria]
MDSASLSDLRGFFESKLQVVQTLLELRDFSEDDTCTQEMQVVKDEVRQLTTTLAVLRLDIEKQATNLQHLQGVNEDLVDLKARLAYMTDNIPDRLPRPTQSRKAESPAIQRTALKLVTNQINTSGSVGNQMKTNISSSKSAHCKQVNVYLPEIDFLTVEEFESCPKYMKGRLGYDHVNKFVEAMNAAYHAKYKLLKQKKSTLNDFNRKLFETYNSQKNKDTQDCYFIVDEDIKLHGKMKIDKTAQSTLAILRHCGRVREVRGGRLARYVYIDRY